MGEMSAECYVDIPKIARETIKNVGYCEAAMGFDYKTCSVLTSIGEQSDDIALGVNRSLENKSGGSDPYDLIGAGDQGMVYGYACSDTPEFMPMPILLAHRLTKRLANASRALPFMAGRQGAGDHRLRKRQTGVLSRGHRVLPSTIPT